MHPYCKDKLLFFFFSMSSKFTFISSSFLLPVLCMYRRTNPQHTYYNQISVQRISSVDLCNMFVLFQVLWKFIGANFETAPRTHYMSLLGYNSSQVSDKVRPPAPVADGIAAEVLADKMENLGTNVSIILTFWCL